MSRSRAAGVLILGWCGGHLLAAPAPVWRLGVLVLLHALIFVVIE